MRHSATITLLCFSSLFGKLHVLAEEPPPEGQVPGGEVAEQQGIFEGGSGEQFRYSPPMKVVYNPHGSANRAVFEWKGNAIGGMILCALPPDAPDAIMDEVVTRKMKDELKGTAISSENFSNAAGCKFQIYTCTITRDGAPFKYFLYMYYNTKKYANPAQELMRQSLGCYKFDFIVPQSESVALRKELDSVFKSFVPGKDRGDK